MARIGSQSGFLHLDYNVSDRWRVSGGARYTRGQIEYHLDHPPLLTVADPFTSPQKRWDWLFSTDYRIAGDILVYASAATGSRPPGVVTVINTAQQFLPTAGRGAGLL
ncbi:MAG: TonB-dependent receptor [Sphingomonas sp.]